MCLSPYREVKNVARLYMGRPKPSVCAADSPLVPGPGSPELWRGDKSRYSFDPSVSLSVRLSVCQLVSAVARVAGNEWTCDKWSGA